MPTDRLVLKPTGHPKQLVSDDISEVKIDHQNRNSSSKSSEMSSKNVRGRKKRKGRSSNVFNIVGNQIKGDKADRVGIFGFGNTHVHKRPRERKTSRLHGQ
ncbi:hypothetical protein Pyn_26589 [Prunus yedoensis var. nudiflora]|uniref:Uncharacterized protein n=1 Tax=Prunus yedoensis var. nudiflora TaxID=2094558 RepID=A0A314V1Y9_PRUYE|nr:hypothetical protein Pyn_26589 [Prunus yedoensis var. nudiflora]